MFSTAEDHQSAVTVHVLQGEREMASANKSLGRFDLGDIPPAPRGVPQIEVAFDIDANGILNVSARDKATGKKQSIAIKASSGLSEDDIKRMVSDAEAHRDEDRKFHELVDARNKAEGLIHATTKSMGELGSKLEAGEKQNIDAAVNALKEALKGDDKAAIEARTATLGAASSKMAERLYAQKDQGPGAAPPPGNEAGGKGGVKDDVVDAEFEEVKDEKK